MQNPTHKKFRTQAKLHFLTYPQCDVPLEEMLKQLKAKAGDKYGWCLISAEDHEERENDANVGVHRHVMQEYNCANFTTSDPRYWDIHHEGKTYHPHFEPVKNKAKCLTYCMKDGQYIFDGNYKDAPFNPEVYLGANKGKQGYGFTYIATQVKQGKTLDQIDDEVPGHVLNHKRKIEEYIVFQQEKANRLIVKPKFFGFEDVEDPEWQKVVDWANKNFLEKRTPKQPQLYLWSEQPSLGKTHPWAVTMSEYYNIYEWVKGDKQGKDLLTCDYILIDEFKGQVTISDLKIISQMMGFNVDIKYGTITRFGRNIPLIITSNHPLGLVYKNSIYTDIHSCEVRFEIVKVDTLCHLVPKTAPVVLVPPSPSEPTQVAVEEHESLSCLSEYDSDEDSEYTKMQKLVPLQIKSSKKTKFLD